MIAYHYHPADYWFFLLNLAIMAGYLATSITLLFDGKILPIIRQIFSMPTRIFGAAFFVLAGITRGQLAWHAVKQEPYLNLSNPDGVPLSVNILHAFQAVTLWAFLIFVAYDLLGITMGEDKVKDE